MKWQSIITVKISNFHGEIAHKETIKLKLSQNVAKSMAYIINQSGVDFQQGDSLYKLTTSIQWAHEYLSMSDRPQKQPAAKADPYTH